MSQPISLEIPPRDPRAELQTRLQNAPMEHAEALLSAYKVLDILVGATKTPESTRAIRNVVILSKILGNIEPELVEGFARSLPEAIALTKAHEVKTPGLWGILNHFRNQNFRRGLVLVNSLLEAFGRNLPCEHPGIKQD